MKEGSNGGDHTGTPQKLLTNCSKFFLHPSMGQESVKRLMNLGCFPHGTYDWKVVWRAVQTACSGKCQENFLCRFNTCCRTGSRHDFAYFDKGQLLASPVTKVWGNRGGDVLTCRLFGNNFHSIVALAAPGRKYLLHEPIPVKYLKAFRIEENDLAQYGGKPLREYIPAAPVKVTGLRQWLEQDNQQPPQSAAFLASGHWSQDEEGALYAAYDEVSKWYADKDATFWSHVARKVSTRTARQCKERYQHLSPDTKRSAFSLDEDALLLRYVKYSFINHN